MLDKKAIEKIRKDAYSQAARDSLTMMLAIPILILKDKFEQLTEDIVDGKTREQRFTDFVLEWYDNFDKGLVSMEDFKKCLWEECGIKIER